jgi:hypothetical protein
MNTEPNPLHQPDNPPSPSTETWPVGPNIVLRKSNGTVLGWPRFSLGHWSCTPIPSGDQLTLSFTEHTVTVTGRSLRSLLTILEQGQGLHLLEYGECHESALDSMEPFIRSATVEPREN